MLSTGTLRGSRKEGVCVPGVLGGVNAGETRPGRSSWVGLLEEVFEECEVERER